MESSVTVCLRGTERYHMEAYLTEKGYIQESPDCFTADALRVTFAPQRKVPLGSFWITEVDVTFTGSGDHVISESDAFRLRFMTAGG